jgi:acyl-CoA synthetase (NDP forming)
MVTLSERESKSLLGGFGLPLVPERTARDAAGAVAGADDVGYPVVLKLNGEGIAHKTERGLVRLQLGTAAAVESAAAELLAAAQPSDGDVDLLVARHISGNRELIAGAVRDPQFGPTVMLGVGGIVAEAVADVVFRPAPLDEITAAEMIDDLRTAALLGPFRGEAAVDRVVLAAALIALGRVITERDDVASIDVNPLVVTPDGEPVAVDALVELHDSSTDPGPNRLRVGGGRKIGLAATQSQLGAGERLGATQSRLGRRQPRPTGEQFRALFEPRGVLIAGASAHPGKFGFVSLHNLLASGFPGAVYAANLQGEEVLGVKTVPDVAAIPDGAVDLVFVCTPPAANAELLKACATKGVKAAFVTSAGYGEAGEEGKHAEQELVALADELGMLLAGPNGQGVVSTPVSLCAQIVAPYPPPGRIGVASQSGNFVSSFMNLARSTGVGISRAISAGNAAAVSIADYLDFYADDPATSVGLAYVEGITGGRALLDQLAASADRKPLVLVKGGATAGGARAAASHTGALAADDKVFDGGCRAAGITRAATVEEAFQAAATFATQPVPRGPRVVVVTTAGGWGVVTADAITRDRDLELIDLPDDLCRAIDGLLPPRWSHNNPIDCAGGETRDTIPEVLRLVAEHESVDAVVYLGIGIQSNQARMMREGRFYPGHGLERIVEYHERQDARFAQAAAELSDVTGKPILTATELAVADPTNPGPATVRATGRLCYASGNRAVTALGHVWRDARHRQRRTTAEAGR